MNHAQKADVLHPTFDRPLTAIDRFFGRLGDSYQRFFGPAFYHGLGWTAAHISFIAWQGPLQRGALNIPYAVVLVMALALATVALMKRWHRQRGR